MEGKYDIVRTVRIGFDSEMLIRLLQQLSPFQTLESTVILLMRKNDVLVLVINLEQRSRTLFLQHLLVQHHGRHHG